MLIETTLYVHKTTLVQLKRGAIISGKSTTVIIKYLMQRVMQANRTMLKCSKAIQYQERDEPESWHRLHIVLNEYEYEYCLDLRKICKMSVSLILAYAVRTHLNELLDKGVSTDNYRFINYLFTREIVDGIICWRQYWGIPEKPQFSVAVLC
jgi:hypothetical protein